MAEAIGWTLLIAALLIRQYKLPDYRYAVPIAGQIHGMLFLAYFGVLIAVSTSLRWSKRRLLIALIAGVPPYGSILFEQWAARSRKAAKSRQLFYSTVWTIISG